MDYSDIKLMSLMKVKMAYHAQNQDLLAQNIANADTPGYRAKELKPLDFAKLALIESRRLEMKATSPEHMAAPRKVQSFREEKSRKTYETTPVKNSVALEEQMAKVAYNNNEYQLTTNLYKKTAALFRVAINGNR